MLKLLRQNKLQPLLRCRNTGASAGFTLLEMLVILLIVGVLSVIVAPSWFSFLAQRRVNLTQEQVSRAIQDAKQKAQTVQIPYTASFRSVNGVLQVAVQPAAANPFIGSLSTTNGVWRNLTSGEVRARQIVVASNMTLTSYTTTGATVNVNQASGSLTAPTITSATAALPDGSIPLAAVTFNHRGILPDNSNTPISITVAAPLRNSNQPTPRSRRCLIIDTLLGSVRSDRDANCLTW